MVGNADDEEDPREGMREYLDGTRMLVFKLLIMHLEETVPGFSARAFRKMVENAVLAPNRAMERNVVTDWMLERDKEIIAEMIPPSRYDPDP